MHRPLTRSLGSLWCLVAASVWHTVRPQSLSHWAAKALHPILPNPHLLWLCHCHVSCRVSIPLDVVPLSHSSAFLIAHSGLGLKLQPSWTPIQLLCSSLLCSLATGNRLPQSRDFRAPALVARATQLTTPTHPPPSQPHGPARRLVSYAQSIAARGFCGTPSAGAGEWHLVWRLQPGPMRRAAPHWRSTA